MYHLSEALNVNFLMSRNNLYGTWFIYTLLYDDAEGELVSCELKMFSVTDVAPRPWWQDVTLLIAFTLSMIVLTIFVLMIRGTKKPVEELEEMRRRYEGQ